MTLNELKCEFKNRNYSAVTVVNAACPYVMSVFPMLSSKARECIKFFNEVCIIFIFERRTSDIITNEIFDTLAQYTSDWSIL